MRANSFLSPVVMIITASAHRASESPDRKEWDSKHRTEKHVGNRENTSGKDYAFLKAS
jgi:hypothetical protein